MFDPRSINTFILMQNFMRTRSEMKNFQIRSLLQIMKKTLSYFHPLHLVSFSYCVDQIDSSKPFPNESVSFFFHPSLPSSANANTPSLLVDLLKLERLYSCICLCSLRTPLGILGRVLFNSSAFLLHLLHCYLNSLNFSL